MPTYNQALSGMKTFSLGLMPGNKIQLILEFASAYEASVAYSDLVEAVRAGRVALGFGVTQITNDNWEVR